MSKRLFPSIPQSITVFVFWLLMVEDTTAGDLLMAAFLAWLMPHIASRLEREFARLGDVWVLGPLALRLLRDILLANITVAMQVLGPERKLRPGFVWVPLELTSIHGITALASIITLTPGTLSTELTADRRHLLVHCFNLKDADEQVASIKTRYERPLKEIFP